MKAIALALLLVGCSPVLNEHSYMSAALAKPVQHTDSERMKSFRGWVAYYKSLMGLTETLSIVEERGPNNDLWCAYVTPDVYDANNVYVVLITGDPECNQYTTEHYAVHELCHIRMKHLWAPQSSMTTAEKHYEVLKCMAEYRKRRKQK